MDMTNQVGGAPAAAPGGKRALLIGVDAYQAVNQLRGCVNDILAIRDFLLQQAGMRAADIGLLLAPAAGAPLPPDVGTPPLPTKQAIKEAFAALAGQTEAQDEVVVYYAGHGVRITNPANPAEHISAIVPVDAHLDGTNFLPNRDLNALIGAIVARGAQVTVVLDACHSGGATRDLGPADPAAPAVREVVLDPAAVDWAAVQAEYGLTGGVVPDAESRDVAGDGSGWVPSLAQSQELIVVSGCRDLETSHEYIPPGTGQRHGALTYFLLDALRTTAPAQAQSLRWLDLYLTIRGNVRGAFPDQTPTLEGRGERPFLGGAWRPYAPGFTVTPAGGGLTLDGGTIHGLGVGAQIAVYPPGTADFAAADAAGAQPVVAEVDAASAVSSEAHITAGDPAAVQPGARARLVRPSTGTPRLAVLLGALPAPVLSGIRQARGAADYLDLDPRGVPPTVEVRPWPERGPGVWALVKYSSAPNTQTADDVIAYTSPLSAATDAHPAELGEMIGDGLVHWARYQAVLTRRNDDPALQGMVRLGVIAGANGANLLAALDSPDPPLLAPNAAGQIVVSADQRLLLQVRVAPASPAGLNVVILLCSDDGNIDLLWPPENADNVLRAGEVKPVGVAGPNPFRLSVRTDQAASLYTFKLIASDEAHPFPARSLTLEGTVQEVSTGGSRGGAVPDVPPVLWTTVEVPVLVKRDA